MVKRKSEDYQTLAISTCFRVWLICPGVTLILFFSQQQLQSVYSKWSYNLTEINPAEVDLSVEVASLIFNKKQLFSLSPHDRCSSLTKQWILESIVHRASISLFHLHLVSPVQKDHLKYQMQHLQSAPSTLCLLYDSFFVLEIHLTLSMSTD